MQRLHDLEDRIASSKGVERGASIAGTPPKIGRSTSKRTSIQAVVHHMAEEHRFVRPQYLYFLPDPTASRCQMKDRQLSGSLEQDSQPLTHVPRIPPFGPIQEEALAARILVDVLNEVCAHVPVGFSLSFHEVIFSLEPPEQNGGTLSDRCMCMPPGNTAHYGIAQLLWPTFRLAPLALSLATQHTSLLQLIKVTLGLL
eukprot:1152538-Pelagomonas_calceolata.AAC.6